MISENEFKRLKAEVEEARATAERTKGALNQLMDELKEHHNCETLKQARTLLEERQTELKKAEKEFHTLLDAYQSKWKKTDGD